MNKKYVIFLLVMFTVAPCWSSAYDTAMAFCRGVANTAGCISSYLASPAAPPAPENPLGTVNKRLLDAMKDGDVDEVKAALDEKADVNARDLYGFTALMKAAMAQPNKQEQATEAAQILIAYGEKSNNKLKIAAKDLLYGKTALMYAAEYGNDGMVRLLIATAAKNEREHGISSLKEYVNEHDKSGVKTALWYAKANHQAGTEKILLDHGAVEEH